MKRQKIKYLSEQEKKQLLNYLKLRKDAERACFMCVLMLNTGLRLAEVAGLNIGDLQGKKKLVIIGKGNKLREVPLNVEVRESFEKFIRWKKRNKEDVMNNAPLFMSKKKNRLCKRQIQREIKFWINEAGIEGNFSPHALRHTVGTELFKKTKNIRLVQDFLGHSFISTTQIYTHITKEEIQDASELLCV
jgi:integrase/recombinase XerD